MWTWTILSTCGKGPCRWLHVDRATSQPRLCPLALLGPRNPEEVPDDQEKQHLGEGCGPQGSDFCLGPAANPQVFNSNSASPSQACLLTCKHEQGGSSASGGGLCSKLPHAALILGPAASRQFAEVQSPKPNLISALQLLLMVHPLAFHEPKPDASTEPIGWRCLLCRP